MVTYIENANIPRVSIHMKKQQSYSFFQGVWALKKKNGRHLKPGSTVVEL